MRASPRLVVSSVVLAASLLAAPVAAKDVGVSTPHGRRIYGPNETFEEVKPAGVRRVVAEAVMGAAPEGHLGFLVGLLNLPVRRLDLYAGLGYEANPSRQLTGSARYTFNLRGFHPYIATGYLYRDLYGIGARSHNAFAEVGYTWVFHQTLRVSVGGGVRRLLQFRLNEDSPLLQGYVDRTLLREQEDSISRFSPLVAVRVSRAFLTVRRSCTWRSTKARARSSGSRSASGST